MTFLALRFDARVGAADAIADALLEAGALSVDVADSHAGTPEEKPLYGGLDDVFVDPWPAVRLTALFSADADIAGVLMQIATALGEPVPAYTVETIADADWVRATQAQFAPIRITDRLWIVPSWCEPADSSAVNLKLDPGLAFGTGEHPTTQLCLRWLASNLRRGDVVLDFGCGSGVVAIAAAKLGAGEVTGVDIDPQAITVSRANAALNDVRASFALPDARTLPATVDIIIANILADPLSMLAPVLAARVRSGGSVVLSGILERQAEALLATYSRWFNIAVWGRQDGWVALAGMRNAR